MHNFIKSKISEKIIIGEQRKVYKGRTKSGKKLLYIALCIVVKYIHGKQVIYLYRNIYAIQLKYIYFLNVMRQHHITDETKKMNKKGY